MLVFIDESGDPGFRTDKGSSPIFVAAMVIFDSGEDAMRTERVISDALERLRAKLEFKFNKCDTRVRDGFFEAVQDCPFIVRAIVVRKEVIWSPRLRTDKENFYRYFVRQMMTYDGDRLTNAKVIIDGSGDREFRNMLKTTLRRQIGTKVRDIRFANSRNDILVQLADMCAGAIARSYRTDRKNANRWRLMLRPRINDI